ncbi:MAG TPA: hypothetical protein PK402_11465, partial [Tepidisphaeraceae bacterium]|nr:hypothetical protein [Tepidisphaeraceae bacterium]
MKSKNKPVQFEAVEARRLLTADLVVSKITPTTTFAGQSQVISYEVEVRNLSNEAWMGLGIGEGSAVLTNDNSVGNADDVALMGGFTIGALNPGAKKSYSVSGTFNPNFDAGLYRLAVTLNTIDGNENNNTLINATTPIELISRVHFGSTITGTAVRDTIKLEASGNNWRAILNGVSYIIPNSVDALTIDALAGPDRITVSTNTARDIDFEINGYGGDDSIQGGDGDDRINGMDGADTIRAGAGD